MIRRRRVALALATLALAAPPPAVMAAVPPATDDPVATSADPDRLADTEAEPQRPRFEGTTRVVASRIAVDAGAVGRREVVVTREEIRGMPVQSVQDLLTLIPGVGLARRGAHGVQGDLNLRGATFEQALVMVNGVRVNNPQTGHHNLDLFVPLAAVERVEVLYGPGSAVHGPDAFGGAINIVTSRPTATAFVRIGENDLTGGGGAAPLGAGLWVAGEREVHTGFRDNTEADVNQLAGGWSWNDGLRRLDLTFAAGSRDFGALRFYSTAFPNQRESTDGALLTLRGSAPVGSSTTGGLALRLDRHSDLYVLDRERPDFYRNVHDTTGALLDLSLTGAIRGWDWALGGEASRDDIDSSNLGTHHRTRGAAFAELGRVRPSHAFTLQARADHQEPWGTVGTAAGGGSVALGGGGWRLRVHAGTSFRAPSFTELHYVSPSRVGDPELEPERGRTLEVGAAGGPWTVTLFRRTADPIIDYLLDDDGVWRARNLGRITTNGFEAEYLLPEVGRLRWQRIGLVLLDSELDVDPARSAYALSHPRAEASWTGSLAAGRGWTAGWAVRWRDPRTGGSWATLDLRLDRRLAHGLAATVDAANILDREITEVHGVPLPGRWVTLSLAWRQPS